MFRIISSTLYSIFCAFTDKKYFIGFKVFCYCSISHQKVIERSNNFYFCQYNTFNLHLLQLVNIWTFFQVYSKGLLYIPSHIFYVSWNTEVAKVVAGRKRERMPSWRGGSDAQAVQIMRSKAGGRAEGK